LLESLGGKGATLAKLKHAIRTGAVFSGCLPTFSVAARSSRGRECLRDFVALNYQQPRGMDRVFDLGRRK
jgi:hypothetical protein